MVELGTRCTTERVQVGNSPPTVVRAAFLSRHPHAGFYLGGEAQGQPRLLPTDHV